MDGELAGAGFWGQFLVGTNADSLAPAGGPLEHVRNGRVPIREIAVLGIPGGTRAFVQMWAWDGTRWGTDLANVPADQFGKTDIVPIFLTYSFDPVFLSLFTQGAIVPIPEPSTWALSALALGAFWLACRRRKFP